MPYTHFWHHYVQTHTNAGGSTLTFDPAMAFAAAVCLFLVACWAAYQIQARCGNCGAIPARCHCRPVRDRQPF